MSHWINIVTPFGRMNAWSAEPDDRPVGGVVIVHDLLGLNDEMRLMAGCYAEAGYLTVVPALFDSIQRDVDLPCDEAGRQSGSDIAERLGGERAVTLVQTAADAIAHAGKVALVGFGWGARIAREAAHGMAVPLVRYRTEVADGDATIESVPQLHHADFIETVDAATALRRDLAFLAEHIRHHEE